MADGISDHAIHFGFPADGVGAVQTFEIVQTDLPRRGGLSDRRVGESTAFPQREQARGKPDLAHGNTYNIFRSVRQMQKPQAIGDGSRTRGNFDGIGFAFSRVSQPAR